MGAWIEITFESAMSRVQAVAPHDGCVDWNLYRPLNILGYALSHPTMGAWIEIFPNWTKYFFYAGRTPRWVRGLKFCK